VKAIVVGAGLAVQPHLMGLRAAGVADITVVTSNPERAARVLALDLSVRVQRDLADALAEVAGSPSIGVVASPPFAHQDQVRLLLEHRLDVLCEKPLGVNLASANASVSAAKQAGRRLAVCLQHRYKPAAVMARQLLVEGAIGEILGGWVTVPWWRPQTYYDQPGRGEIARDGGGVLITQAIHVLDLYLWLAGPTISVTAGGWVSQRHDMEGEDVITLMMNHTDGFTGFVFATTAAEPGYEESIEIVGARGRLRLSGARLLLSTGHNRTESDVCLVDSDISSQGADPVSMVSWFTALYTDLLPALEGGLPTRVDADAVLGTHRVIEAAYRSMSQEGSRVELADLPTSGQE
jgi:UDP-N-acetyl-2-amino-2-deoxyglucuronate dehydrogenase